MPGRTARFFLGRVIKLGVLDQDRFIAALLEPATIQFGDYYYTITGPAQKKRDGMLYISGNLAKFLPEGEVGVIEPEKHAAATREIPNILIASSRFVYLPDFSGIVYEHVWNQIENRRFETVLPRLIREKYSGFFVDCAVEPITDLRTFVVRIGRLTRVTRMQAKVHPPNPLFSPLWKSLRDYMARRRASEVSVHEQAPPTLGLGTQLPAIAQHTPDKGFASETRVQEVTGKAELDITDAAVLMAADGYGKARVEGLENQKRTVIRTRDNQLNFEAPKEQTTDELAAEAAQKLVASGEASGLRH
jgi:hypothetical protein